MKRNIKVIALGIGLTAVLAAGVDTARGATVGQTSQQTWLRNSASQPVSVLPAATAQFSAGKLVVLLHPAKSLELTLGGGTQRSIRPGDELLLAGPLSDNTDTHHLGAANFQCTWQFGDNVMCQMTFTLTGLGQLTVAGTQPGSSSDVTFAVTGGTGIFHRANGEMQLRDLGNRIRLTFKLTL